MARLGSTMAVLDYFSLGSSLSIRTLARVGSCLSVYGMARLGSTLSCLDFVTLGSTVSGFLFRSKTPTAELFATQEKEVVPIRPKTPIVDTRNMAQKNWNGDNQNLSPFSRNDLSRASLGVGGGRPADPQPL